MIDIASEFRYRERRCARAIWRSSSRSRARPPTRWPRCATPRQGQYIAVDRQRADLDDRARKRCVLPTLAGPEIGVASTKAFTCQLRRWPRSRRAGARARHVSSADEAPLVHALIEVPRLIAEALKLEPQIERLARDTRQGADVLYLGRGTNYPAGAGRRAEAQGNLLHPRRGLCRRRAEARPDRADRRECR
jgi:glucosamine--fructose-6-phosphate aminotransferase (isomerizing)